MLQPIEDNIYMLVLKKEPDADYDQLALEVVHWTEAGERDVVNLFTGDKANKLLQELFTRLPGTTQELCFTGQTIYFDDYALCEAVLSDLRADAKTWGIVSVNDYYVRAGIEPTRDGASYGWTSKDLLDARILSEGDQYELWFPGYRALREMIRFSCADQRKPTLSENILAGFRAGLTIASPPKDIEKFIIGRKNGIYPSYNQLEQAMYAAETNKIKESEKQDEV